MDNDDPIDDWLERQPPMTDAQIRDTMMVYFCGIIRPMSTPDLIVMRAYLKRAVDVGPEEQVGLELIDGELVLRELRQA